MQTKLQNLNRSHLNLNKLNNKQTILLENDENDKNKMNKVLPTLHEFNCPSKSMIECKLSTELIPNSSSSNHKNNLNVINLANEKL